MKLAVYLARMTLEMFPDPHVFVTPQSGPPDSVKLVPAQPRFRL